MYDELVRNLRICSRCDFGQNCDVCTQKSDDAFCCDILLHEAADAIEELSHENESLAKSVNEASEILRKRWIPVTERLPEEDGKYLTVYWLGGIPNIPWITPAFFAKNLRNVDKYDFPKKKSGFYDSHSDYGYFEITGITHWMPLPQPPKEEA